VVGRLLHCWLGASGGFSFLVTSNKLAELVGNSQRGKSV
jgi:hypothetical protein